MKTNHIEMEQKFTFFIQGSADYPYRLILSLNPVALSCSCQAGMMGLPCKHRLSVVDGNTADIIGLDPAKEGAIALFSEIIKGSDIMGYLKEYDEAKKDALRKNTASDKAFKNYRSAIIAHALNKGTKKQIDKASAALDKSIQECVNAAGETESLLQALRTVFIRPEYQDGDDMAQEAIDE